MNFVVPQDQFEEKLSELAQTLVNSPGIAFKATKQLIQSSLNQDLKTQLEMEKELIILSSRSDDFEEGLTAFFEKRKPKFQGN